MAHEFVVSSGMTKRWKEAQKAEKEWWVEGDGPKWDIAGIARLHRIKYSGLLKKVGRIIKGKKSDRVLDLGCGPSCSSMYFPYGKKYGVDPLIDEFRKAGYTLPKGMVFRKGIGEKIPFKRGFFDTVMCMNAIDHARDPARVIDECARVLRPGGHLILEIYVHNPVTASVLKAAEGTRFRQRPHPHFFASGDVLELVGRRFEIVDTIVSECDQRLQIPEEEGAPVAKKLALGMRALVKKALVREYLVVGRVRK